MAVEQLVTDQFLKVHVTQELRKIQTPIMPTVQNIVSFVRRHNLFEYLQNVLVDKASQELASLMTNNLTVHDQLQTAIASIKSLNLHRIETEFDYKPICNKVGQIQMPDDCLIELMKLEDQIEEWYTVGILNAPQKQV